MRVLLIAEMCNPSWTSVPLVGYNAARALAGREDLRVTLVTHVRNRAALSGDALTKRADVHFVDTEWLAKPMHRLARLLRGGDKLAWTVDTALMWPGYVAFEAALYRRFRRELRAGDFDLIHRLTPLSPTIPSPLATWTDVPMMVGPLNGGLPWPKEHPHLRRREREWLTAARGAYRALPYYRRSWGRLAAVVSGSRHTAKEIPTNFRGKHFYLPENGVDPERFPVADDWTGQSEPFGFVSVGRLVPYKGFDLLLEALAAPELSHAQLTVIGDGPERANLEALAERLGLTGRVRFAGWLDQRELAAELRRSSAFAFPSLREFGGGVVLEAMAAGLPSVIVDYGGPAELVTPETGILVPMAGREELVPTLRRALKELASDPERCRRLGAAAARRVREAFTWDAKAAALAGTYREVVSGRRYVRP